MTKRRRQTGLAIDILVAALEAELVTATDVEVDEALEDAGQSSVAIDEVRAVLAAACGNGVDDGDLPVGLPGRIQERPARH